MKTNLKNRFLRPGLIVGLGLLLAGRAAAQDDAILYFLSAAGYNFPNIGGAWPTTGLVQSSNVLYGLTAAGGSLGGGTVFSIGTNGTAFTDRYDFEPAPSRTDGKYPKYGLVLSSNMLYGTTYYGGSASNGSVFAVHTDGTGFTILHSFDGTNGMRPSGNLALFNNTLYGTTEAGGGGSPTNGGTVFSIHTDGTGFTTVHDFLMQGVNFNAPMGAWPKGGVILSASGTTLYGTTQIGGTYTNGTVFSVNTDGSGFGIFHSFQASPLGYYYPNVDGCWPMAGLVLSPAGDTLYGTTYTGGAKGYGTVFSIGANGSGFRTVQDFPAEGAPGAYGTGVGVRSISPLVFSANGKVLYGTAVLIPGGDATPWVAGITAGGTVFGLTTSGSPLGIMWTCGSYFLGTNNADGSIPDGVMRVGKALYGTMTIGGLGDGGIVYRLGLGLGATVKAMSPRTATPLRASLGDTIKVVVTVLNRDAEDISNVRLAGPITVYSNGVVAAAGFSGPTMKPVLAPLTKTTFTYLYTATNYGTVNFTAAATGVGADGVVTSAPWTSDSVIIAPKADLMVKSADTNDTTFAGAGEYQSPTPFNDQDVTLSVSSNGAAAYIVRLQNSEPLAKSYVLRCTTNNVANWAVKVLAGTNDILGALRSASGWTTPELEPDAYLDFPVSLSPLPAATVSDNKFVQITVLADSASVDVFDAVRLHATLVPVPVKVTFHKVGPQGYTSESIQMGLTDINAPLVPATDPDILAKNLTLIHRGLVADGVTPLVLKLEAKPDNLGEFPDGKDFVFKGSYPGGGNFLANASLDDRFQVLKDGAWQSTNHVVLSVNRPIAYIQLQPILSDDLVMLDQPPGVFVDFIVQDTAGAIGVQAGKVQFALQKPPIALVHGYATPGDWGSDFKAILSNSRPMAPAGYNSDLNTPNNFIITVKYGQDIVPGWQGFLKQYALLPFPAYENTVAPLQDCAQALDRALFESMSVARTHWAFTRFDVVGHSQGGVLSRMLCSGSSAPGIPTPFRSAANSNRGRFHRVVTIGSPHNGSRLLHYLLKIAEQLDLQRGFGSQVGSLAVLSLYAQPKFDPFLEQIKDINNPDGPWRPDPAASFHLVRTLTDGGRSPGADDWTPSYVALDLSTKLGGLAVIPRGSDGIVDYDSMGANVPPVPEAANVFTITTDNVIAHAPPVSLFGADDNQTASTVVAQHVIGALDRVLVNPYDMVFGPFPLPPLLSTNVEAVIDSYAATGQFVTLKAGPSMLVYPLDDHASYQYQIPFPSDLPPVGDVTWFVQVYDSAGITDDGVALTPWGTNSSHVTATVDNALVGDVVLSAVYRSGSNTVVLVPPTLVVSMQPAGVNLTGFQLLPAIIALPKGTAFSPRVLATYSDGSSSFRYAAPGTVTAVSSQPSVVSVDDPLNWQLSAIGTAQINVTWSGFTAASQITVFDPTSNLPPALSLLNTGNGQLTAAWAGYKMDYVLESSGDLQQTNSWQPVATAPTSGGGWTTVPLAMTNTARFFRLRWNPSAIDF